MQAQERVENLPEPRSGFFNDNEGSGYTKLEGKSCDDTRHTRFSSLEEAQAGCNADVYCKAVYDASCDRGVTGVYLCPLGAAYKESLSSCIYVKGKCVDTNNGNTDQVGDDCTIYYINPDLCGNHDTTHSCN